MNRSPPEDPSPSHGAGPSRPAASLSLRDPWQGLPGPHPDLEGIRRRIGTFLQVTPLTSSPDLTALIGGPALLKREHLQTTGSFKLRGAAAFLTALSPEDRARGVVTCSSGNHGRAVAFMAARLGISAVICVPAWVDPVKLQGMQEAGAAVRMSGETYDQAEEAAVRVARDERRTLVPPFDHPDVVAGQGSLGLEILDAVPDLARIVVPLSGGGLVAGIGLALRSRGTAARLVAVSARNARVMLASLEAGHPVELPEEPTLAGALAGGIGLGNRWTFPLIRAVVDEHLEVSEAQIAAAMRFLDGQEGIQAEGGGAVGVAAALAGLLPPVSGPTVVVVSGGNVAPAVLERVRQG